MVGNQLQNIEQLEGSLWEAADQLRANSKLTSSEYLLRGPANAATLVR